MKIILSGSNSSFCCNFLMKMYRNCCKFSHFIIDTAKLTILLEKNIKAIYGMKHS